MAVMLIEGKADLRPEHDRRYRFLGIAIGHPKAGVVPDLGDYARLADGKDAEVVGLHLDLQSCTVEVLLYHPDWRPSPPGNMVEPLTVGVVEIRRPARDVVGDTAYTCLEPSRIAEQAPARSWRDEPDLL